jgi:hypothetical protein
MAKKGPYKPGVTPAAETPPAAPQTEGEAEAQVRATERAIAVEGPAECPAHHRD